MKKTLYFSVFCSLWHSIFGTRLLKHCVLQCFTSLGLRAQSLGKITTVLYRGAAPGRGFWTKITNLRYRGTAPAWQGPLGKITNLLYRGTASGNGPWTKSRSFFTEAQLLVSLCGRFSYFTPQKAGAIVKAWAENTVIYSVLGQVAWPQGWSHC